MERTGPTNLGDFSREQVRKWRANHFSITDSSNNAPALLRRVSQALEDIGAQEVLDIAFKSCWVEEGQECTVTVYLELPEQQE
jgi:hypothetical protein